MTGVWVELASLWDSDRGRRRRCSVLRRHRTEIHSGLSGVNACMQVTRAGLGDVELTRSKLATKR